MLPFLKNKQDASVSAPAEKIERKSDSPEDLDLLEGCVQETPRRHQSRRYQGRRPRPQRRFPSL